MGNVAARQRFEAEIAKPDADWDLAVVALAIAQEEYPNLDCTAYLQKLDMMGRELATRLPEHRYPMKVIQALNQYLFSELNFQGNQREYYDPRNSFLNDVLDRRKGIPISLALVYLELAKRVDFPMAGVAMPGHFLVRPTVEDMEIFVDVFHQGEILFEEDCRTLMRQLYGNDAALRPDQHLAPIGPRPLLVRILTNLKGIYLHKQDIPRALAAIDRILLLRPESRLDRRDRGLIHYRLGQLDSAETDLTHYLKATPDAPDAFEVQQILNQIRRIQRD
jgi:regulator of sirC expression with transglutaminase-like and TPR domain